MTGNLLELIRVSSSLRIQNKYTYSRLSYPFPWRSIGGWWIHSSLDVQTIEKEGITHRAHTVGTQKLMKADEILARGLLDDW